jgi:SAM-dependent methyltransferase
LSADPPSTAAKEGPEWSATATIWDRHWARLADPARELIAERTGIGPGARVLDMGCGTGEFCRRAAELGATASGIDAAEGMLEIGRERAPECDLRLGAIEALPWDDDLFDVVTGFNSFQFAAERVAAFREAARVTRPGGLVAVCVWGPPGRSDLPRLFAALSALAGEPEEDGQPAFGAPGVMEGLAGQAGLEVAETGEVEIPYEAPDLEHLEAAMEFDVQMERLRGRVPDDLIGRTIADTAAPFRREDGSYRFENAFRWLLARA